MVRSGCPTSCQNRRAIFVAVSIESDPPLVRKTRLSVTGASELKRSASCEAGRLENDDTTLMRIQWPTAPEVGT